MKGKHLIFYDGTCGLCDRLVQFVLHRDPQAHFAFAPLQGTTAKEKLQKIPTEMQNNDSVIFIENKNEQEKLYFQGKATFRILWLLGGKWKAIGWLFFLPSWLYDWAYRLVAINRNRLFSSTCTLPNPSFIDRFLP